MSRRAGTIAVQLPGPQALAGAGSPDSTPCECDHPGVLGRAALLSRKHLAGIAALRDLPGLCADLDHVLTPVDLRIPGRS